MSKQACHRREIAIGTLAGTFSGPGCRAARVQLGISLVELADASGFSVRCLFNFEHQAVCTRADTVEAVFGALQRCSKDELLRMRGVQPAGELVVKGTKSASRAQGAQ